MYLSFIKNKVTKNMIRMKIYRKNNNPIFFRSYIKLSQAKYVTKDISSTTTTSPNVIPLSRGVGRSECRQPYSYHYSQRERISLQKIKFIKNLKVIIIEISWENNDINISGLYNKIGWSHIYKKLVFFLNYTFGRTINLVWIAWKKKVIL